MQDYLLIQGPPGTGKTSLYLMAIIKQHLIKNDTPVVVLAFTNRAVEEICQNLRKNELEYILLGTNKEDKNHISNLFMESIDVKMTEAFFSELEKIKKKIKETKIFVSTVANFSSDSASLQKLINLDLLIVDEASQLLEYQLIGIVAMFQKFILIGDHYQLPAVSTQKNLALSKDLEDVFGFKSLTDSLFERLHRNCIKHGWQKAYDLLPEHYRMHKEIERLVNPFYDDKLRSVLDRQAKPFELYKILPSVQDDKKTINCQLSTINYQPSTVNCQLSTINYKLFTSRTIFINTIEISNTRFNIEEAEKVIKIINIIYESLKENFLPSTIGVICTWKLQANLISSKLIEFPYNHLITIDTVERFQGSERDVIIYSTAISSQEQLKRMQSLTFDNKVDRKLNVAISRAKEQFIMLGNKEILSESVHYKNIIDKI